MRKFLAKKYPNFFKLITKHKDKIKYIISGGLATVVNLLFLFVFFEIIALNIIFSASLAWLLAFLISFSLQKFWTFRNFSSKKIPKQVLYYFILAIISLILNARWMYLLVESLEVFYILAQIIVLSVLAILNFFAYKFLIFKEKK